MAWFKFGRQDAAPAQEAPVEIVESMRSRAKRRLIGALVLVVLAVVGFPLLFETQPRPALVDVAIEVPDKTKVKPLAPPVSSEPASAAKVEDRASLGGREEIVPAAPAGSPNDKAKLALPGANAMPSATKSVAVTPSPPDSQKANNVAGSTFLEREAAAKAAVDKAAAEKAEAAKAAAQKAKADADAAKAKALLEGKAVPQPVASEGRFIVQFGSFADADKAREVRQKVEKIGLKTYAQIAETSEGKRHRARVGPFATRAEADKAAEKIKALGLPANILTL